MQVLDRDGFAALYFELDSNKGSSVEYRFLNNKLFRYSLIKDHRFNESFKTAEDQDFIVINVMPVLNKAVITCSTVFRYRLRKSSLSHTNRVLQDYETFAVALDNIDRYSDSARQGIEYRFIDTAYIEFIHSIYIGDNNKRDELLYSLRNTVRSSLFWKMSNKEKRRFLTTLLPKFIIYPYFKKRANVNYRNELESKIPMIDYFE